MEATFATKAQSTGTNFDSPFVNEKTIDEVVQRVADEGQSLGVGGGGLHFDSRRFAVTVEYMKKFGLHQGYCVEIGSLEYISSRVIWSFFPEATVRGTSNDLRNDPMPFADNSIDNLICTEVIEHISDINYKQATTLDGIFFFLDELHRILRVGGRALISTPNASSLWALQQALMKNAPLMYDWHFREFTKSEMQQIIEYAGFNIVAHNTEFVWHLWDFSPIESFLKESNYDLSDRGDDQFIVIEKTANRIKKPHSLLLPSKKAWKESGVRLLKNNAKRKFYNLKLWMKMKLK
jgi:Uncharacterized protein conserved in bacteria